MKLTFVIPTEEFATSAGARIRYLRLASLLDLSNWEVSLVPVAEFPDLDDAGDVVIISKCFDARAILAAHSARAAGKLVGVDLFDDYFSQAEDSRMTRYRVWLRQMLDLADFACCSTPRMAEIVTSMQPDLQVHIFNDPASDLRTAHLPAILQRKREEALAERRIKLCWFGIGDNPFFSVGLNDVVAYAGALNALKQAGWQVDFTICTNERALVPHLLARLQTLPFPTEICLWSEELEARLLLQSTACFLPVNAQPFSIAKSLNRAVSALACGCQVIATGYPLYAPLADLIYTDAAEFLADLEGGMLRHTPERLDRYAALMQDNASLEQEADKLKAALTQFHRRETSQTDARRTVLVHGRQTNPGLNKLAKECGIISVRSPLAPDMACDVVFTGSIIGGDLRTLVSDGILAGLSAPNRRNARLFGKIANTPYFALDWPEGEPMRMHDWKARALSEQLVAYNGLIESMKERLEALFGPVELLVSENSSLPFCPTYEAAR